MSWSTAKLGDAADTAAAFARAAHVVGFDTWVQRITGVPMEPRAAVAEFDPDTGRYTLYAGSGGVWRLKDDLASILAVPPQDVRVIMREVGGNFGTRGMIYAEFALVAWAARRLEQPVKWTADRHEVFLCDYQARDLAVTAELALDAQGNFLAMRGSNISNAGAHTTNYSPLQKGVEIMTTIYRVPVAHFRARAVVSNTSPTRPYRSAGRPEVMYVMERLIDLACREHGFDRVEIRRRNLVAASEFPYRNAFGMVYDSGAYHHTMEWALRLGDRDGFAARRAAARARGKLRGIGVANYLDTATGVARERTGMTVHPDGWIGVVIGTSSQGQGHETSFAQLVNEWFDVPIENVRFLTHDGDLLVFGGGAHSGRGMRLASQIMWKAATEIIARGKRVAALLLQAKPEAITFASGRFSVGADQAIGLFEVAEANLAAHRPAGGTARAARRGLRRSGPRGGVPVRLPCLRSRERPRSRLRRDHQILRRRRCRPRRQSDDHRRADPWRHRPGRRPGAPGTELLRRPDRAAAVGIVHGLCDAARRHPPVLRYRNQRGADAGPSARHPSGRRRRHHPGARRHGQCGGRCARRFRRAPRGNACDAGAHLARHARHVGPPAHPANELTRMSNS
jgi:CO/xanthine dehydrogenase Mo-binding subunit